MRVEKSRGEIDAKKEGSCSPSHSVPARVRVIARPFEMRTHLNEQGSSALQQQQQGLAQNVLAGSSPFTETSATRKSAANIPHQRSEFRASEFSQNKVRVHYSFTVSS